LWIILSQRWPSGYYAFSGDISSCSFGRILSRTIKQ